METMSAELAETLRTAVTAELDRREISLLAFSREVKVAQPVLHRFLYDDTDLRLTTAQKLLDHFGLDISKR